MNISLYYSILLYLYGTDEMYLEVRLRLACYFLTNHDDIYSRMVASNWGLTIDQDFDKHMYQVLSYEGQECWLNCWDVDVIAKCFNITIQLLFPYIKGCVHPNDALDSTYRYNAHPGTI